MQDKGATPRHSPRTAKPTVCWAFTAVVSWDHSRMIDRLVASGMLVTPKFRGFHKHRKIKVHPPQHL